MSALPLEVERRFERRWAARFFRPNKLSREQTQQPENPAQLTGPATAKRKARRAQATSSRSAPAA